MTTQYVSRTYRDLWTAVELHRDMVTASKDKDNRLALRFSTMLLLFFTFEAYLNHLGEMVSAEVWNDERNYFNGRKEILGKRYFGPIGKLEYLQSICNLSEDGLENDFTAIKELKGFRDLLAHGKTEQGELPISCTVNSLPEPYTPTVWQHINSDLMERSFDAVKSIMTLLHNAAIAAFPDSDLEPSPFVSSFIQVTDVR